MYRIILYDTNMEMRISDIAMNFFKKEMDPPEGRGIRLKGKVYGSTNIHEGISVAVSVEAPKDPFISIEEDGVLIFAEKEDQWLFADHDLEIDYDEDLERPTFFFV